MNYASVLTSESVLILDPASFNEKIEKIRGDGASTLQCVFDFDATISSFKGQSCHNCLEQIQKPELRPFFDALNSKFMKIEFDPNLTTAEKIPHMEEWWITAHQKMIEGMFYIIVVHVYRLAIIDHSLSVSS